MGIIASLFPISLVFIYLATLVKSQCQPPPVVAPIQNVSLPKQTRGSLVLGGVDRSLIADQNDNFTASLYYGSKCGTGMLVTISDILMNWPNGTDMSIFMGSQSAVIQTCISPSFAGLISLPQTYYGNFWSLAGGTSPDNQTEARSLGINYFTMLFDPKDAYYGGLTIKLQNSVSVKVANIELVVPDTYIAANGAVQTNTSVRNVVVNSLQTDNGNDMPVLGRLFMSSAYVMVNHDAGRFSVWQANTASRTTGIVALGKQNNAVNQFCTDSSPKALPPSSSESPPPSPEERSTLSRGAIAGIAVGSAAGLVMLCGIGFILSRRRASSSPSTDETPKQEPESQIVDTKSPTHSMVTVEPQELPVQYEAAELDGKTLNSRR